MLTKLELYAIGLAILLAVGGGLYAVGHHAGYREREDKDEVAAAELQKKVDRQTQELRDKATAAETIYAIEHQQADDYRRSHPDLDINRLCDATRTAVVPAAKGVEPGSKNPGTPALVGSGVPKTDSWSGEDRRALLSAFASLFDETDSRLREWQGR